MQSGRLPWLGRDELTDEQRKLYDAIVGGPRAKTAKTSPLVDDEGRFYGPFNAQLIDPPLGDALQQLGVAVRYRSSLSDRVREMAILEVAAVSKASFEWDAHVGLARAGGVSDADIEAIKIHEEAPNLSLEEKLARRTTQHLIAGDLDDAAYDEANTDLGAVALFDLIVLVGHYQMIARLLQIYRVPLPPGSQDAFSSEPT